MAHTRLRQLEELFAKLRGFSPIIGVFGHRQVGKSTFLSKKISHYLTLDNDDILNSIRGGAYKFLTTLSKFPVALDECQVEPKLFPALKEWVRTHKQPGQFILSGSVRFTSRRAIRESLAGRLSTIEMYPLILSEIEEIPLPNFVPKFLEVKEFSSQILETLPAQSETKKKHGSLLKYFDFGGLPGICFVRSERLRIELLVDLHRLILDRDLRLIHSTRLSLELIQQFIAEIATLAGNAWDSFGITKVQKKLGISPATQKALIYALESTYMIRRIPIEGRSGEIYLLEDQFEEKVLSQKEIPHEYRILGAFYRNARAQFSYRLGEPVRVFSYWTRSGARIPLCFSNQNGVLGFVPLEKDQENPTLSQSRAVDSLIRRYPGAKAIYLTANPIKPKILDARSLICPAAALL